MGGGAAVKLQLLGVAAGELFRRAVFGFEIVDEGRVGATVLLRDEDAIEGAGEVFVIEDKVEGLFAPEKKFAGGTSEYFFAVLTIEETAHEIGGGTCGRSGRRWFVDPFDLGQETVDFGAEFAGVGAFDDGGEAGRTATRRGLRLQ